jgi:pimeloyl-ACP methyl ester carboxylesterase
MIPIIYLHGFASGPSSTKARYFRDRCAEIGVTIEVPDLAEGNFEGLTITGQLAVITRLAAGRSVHLIGSSMGGYLAALYAARHPEVSRVILMAPGFCFAHRFPEYLGFERAEEWQRQGYLEMFHYADKTQARIGYQLIEDARSYEDFPDVRQPVLLFHGRLDDVVPLSGSAAFTASRPNVTLRVFESNHELTDVLETMWVESRDFLGLGSER